MTKHMPKVPPASRSTKGPGGVAKTAAKARPQSHNAEQKLDEQGDEDKGAKPDS